MQPDSGPNSPFAARARTRAPFVTAGSQPPVAPAAVPAAPQKKSPVGLIIGISCALVVGVVAFMLGGKRADNAAADAAATAATNAAAAATPLPAEKTAPARNPAAEYAKLSEIAGTITIADSDRPKLASATLLSNGGNNAEAAALLGPIVWRGVDQRHQAALQTLAGVKLSEHTALPEVAKLLEQDRLADDASAEARWAAAATARAAATSLVPEVRTAVTRRLADEAAAAASRGDVGLATYFYSQVLRLAPDNTAAATHLYRHRYTPGQRLVGASGIAYAYAPPGEFVRGSRLGEPGRDLDEQTANITLTRGFFIGVNEISQRQWDAVYGAGAAARVITSSPTRSRAIGPELPMHSVTWEEAREFCEKLSAIEGRPIRLPTEAEWEYACRAGTVTAFNTGTDSLSAAEANIDDGSATAVFAPSPVGTLGRPNAWGLFDCHGNVWEWCADWSAPYPVGPDTDPRGPADEVMGRVDLAMRVVRGGGWNAPASEARSANRWEHSPVAVTGYLGFRVVLEPDLAAP